MKRLVLCLLVVVVSVGGKLAVAHAQPAAEASAEKAAGDSGSDLAGAVTNQTRSANPGEIARRGWSDVVVVPRKPFLKGGRLELFPFTGVSLNDVLIRHYSFGGDLNYFLSDVFSIGIQGQYFVKERTDRESVVGLQYNRVASLNKYKFAGSLNFGYTPGYGKFTLFNKYIIHWDLLASAGVGMIQSEIIPRMVGDASFKSNRLAANLGIGTHLYVSNWLTFNVALRDYLFSDKLEPLSRKPTDDIGTVRANAVSQFTQNVMLYAGVGLYLPTSFEYRTPR